MKSDDGAHSPYNSSVKNYYALNNINTPETLNLTSEMVRVGFIEGGVKIRRWAWQSPHLVENPISTKFGR